MRLSVLQRHILMQAYGQKGKRVVKSKLKEFYTKRTKPDAAEGILTKSIERLIDKELLVGYGVRTPHKWFIREIRLTSKGRKVVKLLIGRQQTLPLK